jgi:hypothetical protein
VAAVTIGRILRGIGRRPLLSSPTELRTAVALGIALDAPLIARGLRGLTGTPTVRDVRAAGVDATLAVPAGRGPWSGVVFVNGVTARGRRHPLVARLAEGLARAGLLTLVPDADGLATGELTPATVRQIVEASLAIGDRPDVAHGAVALYGTSAGTALALIAAQDEALRHRASIVAGTVPYAHLREATRVATTGTYALSGPPRPWRAPRFLGLVIARSIVAGLRPSQTRDRLRRALQELPDDTTDPFAPFRFRPSAPHARAVAELLTNEDPERFDALYAALPRYVRDGLAALSPLPDAAGIAAPVELVSSPRDAYFPLDDGRALVEATGGRLTVTRALEHAVPSPRGLADAARLYAWATRAVAAARA